MLAKRLAIICQHFYPEMLSTGLFMTHIATGLVQKGWAVRVYCAQPHYLPEGVQWADVARQMNYEGVEVIRVPALGTAKAGLPFRLLNALTFLIAIGWFLWRDRAQLQGVINTTNPPFLGLVAWLAKWLLGLPFITIIHDIYPDVAVQLGLLSPRSPLTWLWAQLTRLILNQSAALVVIGRDMAQLVRPKLRRRQLVPMSLIPHWADESTVYPVPRAANRFIEQHGLQARFVIQYAGRMGRVHNLEPLIEAAELLQGTPALFQFIGDGAKREALMTKVAQAGLTNVHFLPYQPYETLAHVFSAADVAVVCLDEQVTGASVPSKSYGILACARPILALVDPASEIGRLVSEADCGVIVAEATGATVADAIRALMAEPARRAALGQHGYQAFCQNYTRAIALERYDMLLRQHFDVPRLQPVAASLQPRVTTQFSQDGVSLL